MMAATPDASSTPSPAIAPTDARAVRAATEYMATYERAPGVFEVHNDEGDHYLVDVDGHPGPSCTCEDFQYRCADSAGDVCKHVKRVLFERGELDLTPLQATDLRIDPLLADAADSESEVGDR